MRQRVLALWVVTFAGCWNVAGAEQSGVLAAAGSHAEPPATSAARPAGGAAAAEDAPAFEAGEASVAGGRDNDGPGCDAEAVTLAEVHSGRVRPGIPIKLSGLVASSQKFLVSEAKSGACLWGAFVAGAELSGAGSGLLLVSFGSEHAAGEPCVADSDALPSDLRPGDELEVEGTLDEYAPTTCPDVAPAPQLRVDPACPPTRAGSVTPPRAASIDFALADQLAAGADRDLLRAWSGALVRLDGASAEQDPSDGDAVFSFGVLKLVETELEVHSRLYYFDLAGAGPRDPSKAPAYGYPAAFDSLTGVVFLDYCSWSLAPRDRCSDLAPASRNCDAQARGP